MSHFLLLNDFVAKRLFLFVIYNISRSLLQWFHVSTVFFYIIFYFIKPLTTTMPNTIYCFSFCITLLTLSWWGTHQWAKTSICVEYRGNICFRIYRKSSRNFVAVLIIVGVLWTNVFKNIHSSFVQRKHVLKIFI